MAHIALYRSWRPQRFSDMVGQQHIVQTLQNALREGRTTHAYLFCGPRGTGKTSAAKILAKAVNCRQGTVVEPCNECDACVGIAEGSVLDVLEIDAASNRGVDEIREIRDKVKYAPSEVRRKVYIIDEVHMLTTEAFNALLKTLEEPPSHVMFILATTEPHKLPATIVSRCQRYDFRRVPLDEQVRRLEQICRAEAIEAEREALEYVARLSDGGMRDALSILDQVISFSGGRVTLEETVSMTGGLESARFVELAEAMHAGDVGAALRVVETLMQEGKSAEQCIENLIYYFRDLLVLRTVPDAAAYTDRITDPAAMKAWAEKFSSARLFQMIDVLNRYQLDMRYSSQPQTMFEVAVMKLCLETEPAPRAEAGSAARGGGTSEAAAGLHAGPDAVGAGGAPGAAGGADFPSGAGSGDSGALRALERRLEKLERELERLQQAGGAGGGSRAEPARRPAASGWNSAIADMRRAAVKLDAFVEAVQSAAFRQVAAQWPRVLQQVKQTKVTVHAWLIDGEPVSATDDAVLLAFKSVMHRDTTDKPANRELIERVMEDVLGRKMRLVSVLWKDWQSASEREAAAKSGETADSAEPLLQYETEERNEAPDWIEEAIGLFGKELVVVKDDET